MTTTQSTFLVPPDNIRLPDAITIKHGPARVLSRFYIAADNMAQALGVNLKFRSDFHALMRLNEAETARGTWYKMHPVFDPNASIDLKPENAFWIAAEDDAGEVVATQCGLVFDWTGSSLADEARLMFYGGRDLGQKCVVKTPLAKGVTGWVYYAGGGWVAPEYRGSGLSTLLPHIARAYAVGRWPLDCATALINVKNLVRMQPSKLGYTEYDHSIVYPDYPGGEVEAVVCRLKADEIYADFNRFAADWREYVSRIKRQAA
jgi:hypothetical protein